MRWIILLVLLGLIGTSDAAFNRMCETPIWTVNASYVAGLPTANNQQGMGGAYNVFNDSNWTLFWGQTTEDPRGRAYYWNRSQWMDYPGEFRNTNASGGNSQISLVWNWDDDGKWTAMTTYNTAFSIETWNGSNWTANSTRQTNIFTSTGIVRGALLPPGAISSKLAGVFGVDCWILGCGNPNGTVQEWNGTQWNTNDTLSRGLYNQSGVFAPVVGNYSNTSGKYFILSTDKNGVWHNFSWNGTQWVNDSEVGSGLRTTPAGDTSGMGVVFFNLGGDGHNVFINATRNAAPTGWQGFGWAANFTFSSYDSAANSDMGGNVSLSSGLASGCGMNTSMLESNITGVWTGPFWGSSISAYSSNTSPINATHTASNSSAYNTALWIRIRWNDSSGNVINGTARQFYQLPYLWGISNTSLGATSFTCTANSTCTIALNWTGNTTVTVNMSNNTVGGVRQCNYNATNANKTAAQNTSDSCTVMITRNMGQPSNTILVTLYTAARQQPRPSNLPTALAATGLSGVILIYSYIIRRRYS